MDGTLLDKAGPRTRDRCPGVIELHDAADGMLARLRSPGGRLTAGQLVAVADLAAQGNGIAEITSRANVQVRGFAETAGEGIAASMAAAGLLPSPAHERVRNIVASPFVDRHPASRLPVDEIVRALDRGLCAEPELAGLPGRVLFVVEDGSGVLAGLAHDVALAPGAHEGVALLIDGRDTGLRATGAEEAASLAIRAARAVLAAVRDHPGAWAVRELPRGATEVIARIADPNAATGTQSVHWPTAAPAPLAAGITRQRDGRVAMTALAPLGRLSERQLRALADLAPEVRVSPWRTITALDLDDAELLGLERALRDLGLVVEADSGWVGLSACAGLGACGSARDDVRSAAAGRAAVREPGVPAEHWTACPRRCGERPGMAVAVAAVDGGVSVRRGAEEEIVDDFAAALDLLGGIG